MTQHFHPKSQTQTIEFFIAEHVLYCFHPQPQNWKSTQNLSVYIATEEYESDSRVRSLTASFLSSEIIWLLLLPFDTYTGVCTV